MFDTERWARYVESLDWRAWKKVEQDNKPQHIYGSDVYENFAMLSSGLAIVHGNGALTNAGEQHNNNGYEGTELWHSESPFNGRMFNHYHHDVMMT